MRSDFDYAQSHCTWGSSIFLAISVAEPPGLFRLKCVNDRYAAIINATHFKRDNPLVCRVSAWYNHGSTGSKQAYLARRRVYNHRTAHQLLIYRYLNIITNQVQTEVNLYKQRSNWQAEQLVQTHSEKKRLCDYTHREGRHQAQPKAWGHSGGSLPAGDGSHSTDQPKGTEVGYAGLSMKFSKVIPEIDTNKAKHSNTTQGLPEFGYTLARN
jgi:hypothetical protein